MGARDHGVMCVMCGSGRAGAKWEPLLPATKAKHVRVATNTFAPGDKHVCAEICVNFKRNQYRQKMRPETQIPLKLASRSEHF